MKIKGLDIGYLYSKDDEKRLFKSAISRTDRTLSDNSKILINGDTYYFGVGNTVANADKIDSDVNKVCTLANLAMSPNEEIYLVTGLPIGQYKQKKDTYRDVIMSYNKCEVTYKGKTFYPQIKDVTIFAQGAGALFDIGLSDGEYISFDIGSYTINVVLVDIKNGIPYITKYDTWYDGVLNLYNEIISQVNNKFDLTLDIDYAEKIFSKGLNINGRKESTDFLTPIMNDYLDNILTKFKTNYPFAITPIILSGGGSNLLCNIFEKNFSNYMLLPDSQFANSIGYYKFGLQKYGHLLERSKRYA